MVKYLKIEIKSTNNTKEKYYKKILKFLEDKK